ncbi:MAG: GntR family transcriptional regulator [Usitatibacter sp.]
MKTQTGGNPRSPRPVDIPAVSSPLLIEETARVLRELIVNGTLEPGRRLSERELGGQMGVSRTPLREALRLLAGERLVEVLPRRGARVALLDTALVEDVYPVLACIERLAVDLACRHVTDADLERLADMLDRMKAARARGDKQRFSALSREFHVTILDAAENTTLREMHRQLSGQVRRARFLSLNTAAEWDEAMREHRQIMGAVRKRNGAAAVKAISQHLHTNKRKVLTQLAQR